MKVVLFGATGMVGQGVLRGCLLDPDVESVLAVVRTASLPQQDKLREIAHQDVSDLAAIEDRLSGYDACFFCLGVSSVGMKEETYRRVTYDLTVWQGYIWRTADEHRQSVTLAQQCRHGARRSYSHRADQKRRL